MSGKASSQASLSTPGQPFQVKVNDRCTVPTTYMYEHVRTHTHTLLSKHNTTGSRGEGQHRASGFSPLKKALSTWTLAAYLFPFRLWAHKAFLREAWCHCLMVPVVPRAIWESQLRDRARDSLMSHSWQESAAEQQADPPAHAGGPRRAPPAAALSQRQCPQRPPGRHCGLPEVLSARAHQVPPAQPLWVPALALNPTRHAIFSPGPASLQQCAL